MNRSTVLRATMLCILAATVTAMAAEEPSWWNPQWQFRTTVTRSTPYRDAAERPVEIAVDLQRLLQRAGVAGEVDPASLRVVQRGTGAEVPLALPDRVQRASEPAGTVSGMVRPSAAGPMRRLRHLFQHHGSAGPRGDVPRRPAAAGEPAGQSGIRGRCRWSARGLAGATRGTGAVGPLCTYQRTAIAGDRGGRDDPGRRPSRGDDFAEDRRAAVRGAGDGVSVRSAGPARRLRRAGRDRARTIAGRRLDDRRVRGRAALADHRVGPRPVGAVLRARAIQPGCGDAQRARAGPLPRDRCGHRRRP